MKSPSMLIEQLISQLYEGVLTNEGWGEALRTISAITQSPQASVVVFDKRAEALAVSETFGIPQEAVVSFNAHYHQLDEGRLYATTMPFGHWYLDRRDIGEEVMRRSEYYQDFLIPHDMATTLCNRLLGDESADAFLSLQRRLGQPHYTDADLMAFGCFVPHVQRAVRLRMHMQRLSAHAGLASVVLDSLNTPLLVLDEHSRILLSNAEADALLRRLPQLMVYQGCLHLKGIRAGLFEQLLRSACGRPGPAIAGGASIAELNGLSPLQLLVLPMPACMQAFNHWQRPLALVLFHDPNQAHSIQPHLLQQLYGLTPAEARLALTLYRGNSPAQAAQHQGISVGTVRVQLKAIFAKTGVSRQSDLMRLLSALGIAT